MAGELNIKRGAKIFMAYDVPFGTQPRFDMIVSFAGNIDEAVFLVSVPMTGDGEQIGLDENRKLLLRYGSGPVQNLIAGYADDMVYEGMHTYWKVRRVTEHRQFFKRQDERVKAQMRMEYTQDSFPEKPDGTTERESGYTLDISYNGAAFYLNRHLSVGEICAVFLPGTGTGTGSDPMNNVEASVCWIREAPQGSLFRLVCGIQYRFSDGIERERMKLYVEHVKRVGDN